MIKSDRKDSILSFAIFFPTVLFMFQQLLLGINLLPNEILRTYNIILSSLPLIYAFKIVFSRNPRLVLLSYVTIILLLLSSYNNYNNREYLSSESFFLIFVSIPIFLSCASIRNIEILKSVLFKISIAILIIGIILLVFIITGKIEFTVYSMATSYYLLLPTLVFAYQKKNRYKFLSLVGLLIILLLGSRGPFIIALFYYVVLILSNIKLNTFKSYILIVFLITSSLIILSVDIVSLFNYINNTFGIDSRTLDLLAQGQITYDAGRDSLTKILIDSISNSGLWGYGIFGDRPLLDGTYAHNFFLEVIVDFGIIFGVLIIIIFVVFTIRKFLSSKDKTFFLLFFSYGFLPLIKSGSYLTSIEFSIFVGYLILINKRKYGY